MARGKARTLLSTALRATSAGPARLHRNFCAAAAAEELENPTIAPVEVKLTKLLIDGEFVDAASGKTFPTIDPRSEQVIAHVAEGDVEDVNRAVRAARKAFDHGPWPKMPPFQRQRILLKYVSLFPFSRCLAHPQYLFFCCTLCAQKPTARAALNAAEFL